MAYAHETHRPARAEGALWTRVAELRAGLAERVARYRLYRQTVTELGALSDRDLNDLGLHRGMIPSVARKAAGRL